MGLFDKKYCSICGEKIGLLGNRKLEDGNCCKECAKKLSPWFSERRHSTVEEIREQIAYREKNLEEVKRFHTTRTLGKYTKLLLDEDARKFMVTSARDLVEANPDVLDYAQVTGCDLDIDENRNELKREGKDGKQVSYNPPRYEYSYSFHVTVHVNHPYFDEMRFGLNSGSVHTGETPMGIGIGGAGIFNLNRAGQQSRGVVEYNEYVRMGREIKKVMEDMRQGIRDEAEAMHAERPTVICPYCGAATTPDAQGRCEYCGGAV